jgi:hypothetical protein
MRNGIGNDCGASGTRTPAGRQQRARDQRAADAEPARHAAGDKRAEQPSRIPDREDHTNRCRRETELAHGVHEVDREGDAREEVERREVQRDRSPARVAEDVEQAFEQLSLHARRSFGNAPLLALADPREEQGRSCEADRVDEKGVRRGDHITSAPPSPGPPIWAADRLTSSFAFPSTSWSRSTSDGR